MSEATAAKAAETETSEGVRPGSMNQVAGAQNHGIVTREQNDNAPHYIWIALAAVFIGHRNSGASFLGDFPDEALPAKTPIVITPTRAYAAYELKAIALENTDNAFQKTLPDVEQHPNSYIAENSARALKDFVVKEYADFGIAFFEDLTDEAVADVNNLFSAIFRESYFEDLAKAGLNLRTIEGVEFKGVFLDQLKKYFTDERHKITNRVGLTSEVKKTIADTVLILETAIEKAWSFANAKLNATEELIRERANGRPGKAWYDMPDHRFPDAQPPLDLVCLAQTGRVPLDLKQLDASREMSATIGDSIVTGIKDAFGGGAPAKGGVSLKEVEELLIKQNAKHAEEMAELKASLTGKPEDDKKEK